MEIALLEKTHLKLVRGLRKMVWKVQDEFDLIENGDKILVCLSGGKDSYTMLDMLVNIQNAKALDFELIAVNLDQKQPGFPAEVLPQFLEQYGIAYKILEKNTYKIVNEKLDKNQTMCSLCSRLRRGTLYEYAREIGANKIALGHHREDVLETFFLNLFFGGKLETMPPKLVNDEGQIAVIRPLVYCPEDLIRHYATLRQFPIIPCNLCGSQPKMQRQMIKTMLNQWEKEYPDRKEIIMTALKNIHPTHLYDKDILKSMNHMIDHIA
ncbi:MAG: tRNA 2-thiocytidine(32) synthetase TtcA [Cyclobacteriaceae bacterium]|nr:tRNA 2-thiocytidine(32) synthetase TtcA [Cyclobacteriaceae bacterium]